MYYISNYKKEAIDKIIPYLIEFPQIVKTIEMSADRYQAIEDLLWNVANNFYLQDSRGVFLLAHAHNEECNIIYTDKADDAFTYGTKIPQKQAYGTGHYYSQVGYLSGIKKDISEEKLIRAVQAKIIENNTSATINDLIEALKLYYNADKVGILESYPLAVSIILSGDNLELSSFGNKELIKEFLPACVSLKYVYTNDKQYNIYQFGKETSYGDSRLPIDITDGVLSYMYLSKAISLYSSANEYIKTNYTSLSENMYYCFTGELSESYSGNVLFSSNNNTTNKHLKLIVNEQNYFELIYNNTVYNSHIFAEAGKKYTFILHNSNNKLKLWVLNGVTITGEDKDKDESYIINQIQNVQPSVVINSYNTIDNGILYINGLHDGTNVISGDFVYYAMIFGFYDITNDINDMYDYYITSYGDKQILFNCLSNTNHLQIHSNDTETGSIHKEPEVLQSDFYYSKMHGNSKYAYFNGKSTITYDTNKSFDKSKFTVVGSPTITDDGVASGFSGANHFNIPAFNVSKPWKINLAFTTNSDVNTLQFLLRTITQTYGIQLAVNNGSISAAFNTSSGVKSLKYTASANTKYFGYMQWTGTEYKFSLNEEIQTIASSSPISINDKYALGIFGADAFRGSIDLKQFSITVDGVEVFAGNKYLVYNNQHINNFKFDISLCHPFSLIESNIISGFIKHSTIENNLFVTDSNGLVLTLPVLNTSSNTYQQLTLATSDNVLFNNMFNNISIKYDGSKIEIYNNENIVYSLVLANNLKVVYQPPVLNIGHNEFNGLIKEINLNYGFSNDNLNINLPYMYTLRDDINNVLYTNNGVRLITTPQLINDENKLDLYGNTLVGIR